MKVKNKNKKICFNCKFWIGYWDYDRYISNNLTEYCDKIKNELNVFITVNGDATAYIEDISTKANFGCINFQKK